ncbi:Sugar transport protein [Synechococcus sp. MIT S9509]|uniref:GRP family sugar transporter n=1 Tax=unclassified Synechococcus TaxID=2626047 RepID=UPI0007BBD728|nr:MULTISPECIES: GRP family sugar transporter [unclassified Synechococcus]KZR85857.1 Sugar transport protein [Synechococcus sp. MIT S9504]KZR91921.1 Sugar transport protein [Synechococcus sp. MIT S9509]
MLANQSYSVIIAVMILNLVCWGSWANTQKLTNGIRFEYFYLDYSIGVTLSAFLFGFLAGNNTSTGNNFLENIANADPKHIAYAFTGGIIFNVANFLLVAVIEIAGMSVAFPISIGIATILGGILNYLIDPQGYLPLFSAGMIMMALAVISASLAYGRIKTTSTDQKPKGLVIALICGLLMSLWSPLVTFSDLPGEASLDVFGAFAIMGVGIIASSILLFPYAIKYPIIPTRTDDRTRFTKQPAAQHTGGVLGGIIWAVGTMSFYLASTRAGAAVAYTFGQGAPLMATAWGLFAWKEFKGATGSGKYLIALFAFYIAGLTLLANAASQG